MLNYRGKNYNYLNSTSVCHPLVAYTNHSFDKEHHINESRLESILRCYTKKQSPVYRRLFNEVPVELLKDFTKRNNISIALLKDTYNHFRASTTTNIKPLAL